MLTITGILVTGSRVSGIRHPPVISIGDKDTSQHLLEHVDDKTREVTVELITTTPSRWQAFKR
jgi:hypothetical protein